MEDKKEKAVEIFRSGFNCSQGVFTAFASENGLDEETALMLSTPFGGGVGGCGETCGAVSGAYMVIGLKHGRCSLEDTEAKEKVYALMAEFRKKFTDRFGTLRCSELVGVNMADHEERSKAREEGKLERCKEFVGYAAVILEDMI
ncbi:C-GCAxxG-C-C family protein [Geovibrio thiophilus]|uniref:C-GCAxxG-C-C family protein n=1 Tax=Geovibrio thiophilus TaxID=139438 RepID=UPI0013E31D33|nr:C-GCAxxG-C-C family protein [Geovibrio thiophilus]